jgi:hypothetical protein
MCCSPFFPRRPWPCVYLKLIYIQLCWGDGGQAEWRHVLTGVGSPMPATDPLATAGGGFRGKAGGKKSGVKSCQTNLGGSYLPAIRQDGHTGIRVPSC